MANEEKDGKSKGRIPTKDETGTDAASANLNRKVVVTPLKPSKPVKDKGRYRDITEDDDGYHPFCDGPERDCEFERDPWR